MIRGGMDPEKLANAGDVDNFVGCGTRAERGKEIGSPGKNLPASSEGLGGFVQRSGPEEHGIGLG